MQGAHLVEVLAVAKDRRARLDGLDRAVVRAEVGLCVGGGWGVKGQFGEFVVDERSI